MFRDAGYTAEAALEAIKATSEPYIRRALVDGSFVCWIAEFSPRGAGQVWCYPNQPYAVAPVGSAMSAGNGPQRLHVSTISAARYRSPVNEQDDRLVP